MPRLHGLLSVGIVFLLAWPFAGRAEDFISGALGREIIGAGRSLEEAKSHVEALVPRMPAVKTAADWKTFAERTREDVLSKVIFRGEAAAWRDAVTRVEWQETIEGGPGYRIKKLRYEALPGLWIPALLYEPAILKGKVPAMLNVNGHDAEGKAADYKQIRCINQAKRGILSLNIEWLGMGQLRDDRLRHDRINQIDLCGSGGIATHYLVMTRAIDLLLSLENTDRSRVGVTGLSGGGWQTIFVSAFDTRVTLSNPVAGYSSFLTRLQHTSDLGDSEQTPSDLGTVTDYAVMTAMLAPRPTLLTFNDKDNCCFQSGHALPPLIDAAGPIFRLFGKEANLRSHINSDPGTHNYMRDNRQAHYRMLADHFAVGGPDEILSDQEVKTKETLHVKLPADNRSLQGLALDLSRTLPREPALPKTKAEARRWVDARRTRLREIVRVQDVKNAAGNGRSIREETRDGIKTSFVQLKVGEWSVPVVELVREGTTPKTASLVLSDKGRKGAAQTVKARLDAGDRVFAVDPMLIGESKLGDREYLHALLLATVGRRPLGIQAAEIAGVARWARTERHADSLTVISEGPRTSVMALVAAAIEPEAIGGVELNESYGSLKELLEDGTAYAASPELYCFGLLESFDIAQLAALVAPRLLVVHKPTARAMTELAGLKTWYATWDVDHQPLR